MLIGEQVVCLERKLEAGRKVRCSCMPSIAEADLTMTVCCMQKVELAEKRQKRVK